MDNGLLMDLERRDRAIAEHERVKSRLMDQYLASLWSQIVHPPPYVTVADCGHCFEDTGERA